MMKSEFERTINASDLQEWIMCTFPDWCEGDVRLIYDHIDDMPTAESELEQNLHNACTDSISRADTLDIIKSFVNALRPETTGLITDIYDAVLHMPTAQPDHFAEVSKKGDLIRRQDAIDAVVRVRDRHAYDEIEELKALPSAQPEYEPVTAEDFAKTMSENTIYRYMAWYGEALALMKEQGFVICKRTM